MSEKTAEEMEKIRKLKEALIRDMPKYEPPNKGVAMFKSAEDKPTPEKISETIQMLEQHKKSEEEYVKAEKKIMKDIKELSNGRENPIAPEVMSCNKNIINRLISMMDEMKGELSPQLIEEYNALFLRYKQFPPFYFECARNGLELPERKVTLIVSGNYIKNQKVAVDLIYEWAKKKYGEIVIKYNRPLGDLAELHENFGYDKILDKEIIFTANNVCFTGVYDTIAKVFTFDILVDDEFEGYVFEKGDDGIYYPKNRYLDLLIISALDEYSNNYFILPKSIMPRSMYSATAHPINKLQKKINAIYDDVLKYNKCNRCGLYDFNTEMMRCPCGVFYCDKICQAGDWKTHRAKHKKS